MKKKKIVSLFLIVIFCYGNFNFSYAQENVDIIDKIIEQSNSQIIEYGIKVCFTTKENGENICMGLLNKLGIDYKNVSKSINDDGISCYEFDYKKIKGYTKIRKQNNNYLIIVDILKKEGKNDLLLLQESLKEDIEKISKDIKYNLYIKAKLPNDDVECVNSRINNLLIRYGAENIETIKINNGFSTIAYTKRYNTNKKNGKKTIDFNYAVCNYLSGSYVIIGTPEIYMSY